MSNPLSNVVSTLESSLAKTGSSVVGSVLAFFSGSLVQLAEDELVILGDAINILVTDLKAGKDWETALTDCYNTFYNEEITEAKKIAMAVLEAVGKVVNTVHSITG